MDCVVLLPGIMGSVLETPDGEEVWPPRATEVALGYDRLDQVLREDLRSTDIIRRVSCVGVYLPLISQLVHIGFTEGGAEKRLDVFHYDWRLDLEDTAAALSDRLAALQGEGATTITLVAHSMGGLVARLALETPAHRDAPWRDAVRGLFTIGTPHLGAPQSLMRILGMEGDLGISAADFRTYASDRRYPSAYQLLPAPGEAAVWDVVDDRIAPIDIYDPGSASGVGLDPDLVARAAWLHRSLAEGEAPEGVRYFYFGGGGHKTCTRINLAGSTLRATLTEDGGDGTVPLWSAFGGATQKQVVPGAHTKFFRREEFAAVFYRLFGERFRVDPLRAAPGIDLSVQALVLAAGEEVELLMLPPGPATEIEGTLTLSRAGEDGTGFAALGEPIPIRYAGPPLTQLRVTLPAPPGPGHYRIGFAGTPGADEPVVFSVRAEG